MYNDEWQTFSYVSHFQIKAGRLRYMHLMHDRNRRRVIERHIYVSSTHMTFLINFCPKKLLYRLLLAHFSDDDDDERSLNN